MGIMGVAIDLFLANGSLWCAVVVPWRAPVQSLGILAMVLALSMIAPIGAQSHRGIFWHLGYLRFCARFAMLYSVWVGLRSPRTLTK